VNAKLEPCHTGTRHGAVCERGSTGCTADHSWHALQRIEHKLDLVNAKLNALIKEEQMSQTELDAALSDLKVDVDNNTQAVNDLVAKIEAGTPVADLTAEIQAVKDSSAALEASHETAASVVPPAEPAPPADTTGGDVPPPDTPPA